VQWKRRLLLRRGAAFFQQKDSANAEADYVSALKLDPANETIARDLARIQKARDEATTDASDAAGHAVMSA
jgi:Flp pilus assembly protein TadD